MAEAGPLEGFLDFLQNPFPEGGPSNVHGVRLQSSDAVGGVQPWEAASWDVPGEADEDAEGESEDEDGDQDMNEQEDQPEQDEHSRFYQGAEDEDIPADIGRQMDEATAGVGAELGDHAGILWEEDEDVMMELGESMGENWGPKRKKSRKKKRSRRKRTDLSDALAEVVGHANVAYTMGNYGEAIKLLHDVIRESPNAYQAWATLAMVHDELGDAQKALQTYLMAAHLSPKDAELWRRLGGMSKKLGHMDQAMYCYSKAIRADPTDVDSLWERAMLYRKKELPTKAMNELVAILNIIPDNMSVTKELAKLYLELNDVPKAIELFETALYADAVTPLPPDDAEAEYDDEEIVANLSLGARQAVPVRVGYEEINMLAELYIESGEYELALDAILIAVRRIQGRSDDDRWNQYDDDREFDAGNPGESIPLELRVKRGICFVHTDRVHVAMKHFKWLYEARVEDYGELYFDVGEAFMAKGFYADAVKVFELLTSSEESDGPAVWTKMGRCYRNLGNFEAAAELYTSVLEVTPEDVDVKLALAEVYEEMGDEDKALKLLAEVDEAARHETQPDEISDEDANASAEEDEPVAENTGEMIKTRRRKPQQPDRAVLLAEEKERAKENRTWYRKAAALYEKARHDKIARAEYLLNLRKLLARFQNEKIFYPSERSTLFRTLNNRLHTRKHNQLDDNINEDAQVDRPPALDSTHFQGLTFEEWYDCFIKFATIATIDAKEEDAQQALKSAFDANVFYHDTVKMVRLRLHMIAAAVYAGNALRVTELCRWFCNYKPLNNDMYRLFSAMQCGGSEAVTAYAGGHVAKYFQRQVRLMEAQVETNPEVNNSVLLSLYGHILLVARSYLSAIGYYLRAYRLSPDDPLINFSLGVAHLHRGMQRKSDNRHRHIMQAMTFLMRYHEMVGGTPEANFNVGRAFHQIGLTSLAVFHYDKVLAAFDGRDKSMEVDRSEDVVEFHFVREAAYNLHLIYASNGSVGLAQLMLRDYCTI
ncbi:transcription factor TFIIIC subunit tfc4 [Rhizophlyctis rosea]|uniref:Transcription factor TFIIIC subunit tfc4 n=1 Tax=Rhizophlyctis rosea TaxID=64517 RepID=A0AAD5SME7_9FUNG|nr:transcription factor TFIIIC subunit tfc4 [Rhizophlyctis rosea]